MRQIIFPIAISAIVCLCDPAAAGAPCAYCSKVPKCIIVCPQGDIADTVVVMTIYGNPQDGDAVVLSFDECPGFALCPPSSPASYTILSPTSVQVVTANGGMAIFALRVTGACAGAVRITARGVLLTNDHDHPLSALVNVDQNGDGVITTADEQILAARAPDDPLGDLNCDGVHDASDMAVLMAHLGHQCPSSAVPTRAATWGSLKIRYH